MKKNLATDIWKFIDIREEHECWLYTGGTFSSRYGRFFFGAKPHLAHRFVYVLTHGEIDSRFFVMHKCNNKLCCNPNHLIAGSPSENMRHAAMSNAFPVGVHGIRGISFDKKRGYWKANGTLAGKLYNLYTGPSKEKAVLARKNWETLHGITFDLGAKNG